MASESSFDIVSTTNLQELDNSINQAMKEIQTRFDFKGSISTITYSKEKKELTIVSDDEFKLKAVIDILTSKMVKRGVSIKALDFGKVEPATGMSVRQVAKLKEGIEQPKAKEIVKMIKDSGIKVNAQIQGEQLRVTSKSKDDLQAVINLLRSKDVGIPLQFTNYR